MPKKIDNKANLFKNRRKFVQIFKRKVAGQDVPTLNQPTLQKLLNANRQSLAVTQRLSLEDCVAYLSEFGVLKGYHFSFPNARFTRYALVETSLYAVVGSFYQNAYFSHYSALYLHQLTEQLPKTIYLNFEQTPKPRSTSRKGLLQSNIDLAFSRPQRKTNNHCVFADQTLVLLNGKSTGNEGVELVSLSDQERVRVTGLERTLIDIAVRPSYAGGPQQVLNAFERAKDLGVSVNRLAATLKRLDYVYPYHQVIGFYLERAGYTPAQLAHMDKLDKDHDFYLDYQLQDPDYVPRWRLFVPKGF